MIIRHHLLSKKASIALFAFLFVTGNSFAAGPIETCDAEFEVVKRVKKSYKLEVEKLKDLNCTSTFEGKHFKIVEGTSDKAISFNASSDLVLKAANTYFYLTQARNFWLDSIQADYVKTLPQLTIRVNMGHSYSKVRHFDTSSQAIQTNNAWTVPAGQTPSFVPAHKQKQWGQEVWFSPKEVINTKASFGTFHDIDWRKSTSVTDVQPTLLGLDNISLNGFSYLDMFFFLLLNT